MIGPSSSRRESKTIVPNRFGAQNTSAYLTIHLTQNRFFVEWSWGNGVGIFERRVTKNHRQSETVVLGRFSRSN